MKQLLLMVGAVLLQASWAGELSPLVGDGVSDDTAAIQARLDSGAACVYLPPPKKCYRISKTLRIGSDTELRLDRFSVIRLAPGSDCPMIENKGYVGGDDRRIALTGGIWDMANVDQSPNPQQYRRCKPPREGGLPPKHENDFFFGMAMRFSHVEGMTVKGVTVRNPTSYGMAFCHTSYFLIDDIAFDYKTCNPIFLNMDGVHLDGWCHHGRISNLRGTCFDDLVALNADDVKMLRETYRVRVPIRLEPNTVESVAPDAREPEFAFLTVARFDFQKGYDILLAAIAEAQNDLRAAKKRTLLIGGGKTLGAMKAFAAEKGIADLVEFAGEISNAADEMGRGRILVAPSRWEGSPYAVLEAVACGKKVIASNCPGNKDIIREDENGWLFPTGDAKALAELLVQK